MKVELDLWSFEILLLDGFTTVFMKNRPTQGSFRPCLRREGLCLVCNLKHWLETHLDSDELKLGPLAALSSAAYVTINFGMSP